MISAHLAFCTRTDITPLLLKMAISHDFLHGVSHVEWILDHSGWLIDNPIFSTSVSWLTFSILVRHYHKKTECDQLRLYSPELHHDAILECLMGWLCMYGAWYTWVAMPAWSVPGTHRVGRPRIRQNLVMISCVDEFKKHSKTIQNNPNLRQNLLPWVSNLKDCSTSSVTNMAWPMWRAPVTFGGGIGITNGSPSAAASGLK